MCARCTPTCGCRATRGRFPVPDVETALTDYRDAIRYVYDQTIRQINQGRTPDEIAATLKLPAPLAASPYLPAFYRNAPRTVPAISSAASPHRQELVGACSSQWQPHH